MISTAKQVQEYIPECIKANITPMLSGSPGIGKSAIIHQIASRYNLELIDERMSTYDPVDINGFARIKDDVAQFVPFDTFPLEGRDTLPKGKNGWLVFLDEFNSAPASVQAACYRVILDRQVGKHPLHKKVAIVAAGNLLTDGAIVNRLGTAMQSRMVHLELVVSPKEWIAWALNADIDHRIMAYIEHAPGSLHKFDPKHNDKTFPCPRTWHFLSKLIKNKGSRSLKDRIPLWAGTVGEGTAREFITHVEIYSKMPTYQDIVADPLNAKLSKEPAMLFGVAYMMGAFMDKTTLPKAMQYLDRLPVEFQTICLQSAVQRDKTLIRESDITKWIAEKGKYLM